LPPPRVKQQSRPQGTSKQHSKRHEKEIENLVKAGVERFMFKDATIFDFLKTIRAASTKKGFSPHPLTRAVLSKIVNQAIEKHKRKSPGKKFK
jgi:hypothetical protein